MKRGGILRLRLRFWGDLGVIPRYQFALCIERRVCKLIIEQLYGKSFCSKERFSWIRVAFREVGFTSYPGAIYA